MPDPIVFNAWAFDPAYYSSNSPFPQGWTRQNAIAPGFAGTSMRNGRPLNLRDRIVEIAITDVNENGTVSGGEGDTLTVNGQTYAINQVYDGDRVLIGDRFYEVVTFYVGSPRLAFSFPRDPETNALMNAFPATTTRTQWLYQPNSLDVPTTELPSPPCFTPGTLIDTPSGPVPVEALRVGDLVSTRDNGPQPIRWIGTASLGALRLARTPQFRPIRIRAGALGEGSPARDLLVSPQHRVLVRSAIAQRMFGTKEILIAAKHLLGIKGIEIDTECTSVTYLHILCDRHEVVCANGAETETLFLGPQGLRGIDPAARAEITALFGHLEATGGLPASARVLASGRTGRRLVARHIVNARPLVN
ncbi:MAG: Hint domain-containing protein [Paracoccus sp. (in: a-proteobacteria)]|nr:Hint domain-containing protein [Paracoccus sp. (in: a-proteobacteria)]